MIYSRYMQFSLKSWTWKYHRFFCPLIFADTLELYDINPIFSFYINKLSTIYLFLTLLLVKLFLQAMALQNFLHRFVIVSADLLV